MCEINAYVVVEGGKEKFLESVDIVRPTEGAVYLKTLFGDEKVFNGTIKEISFQKQRIVLQGA